MKFNKIVMFGIFCYILIFKGPSVIAQESWVSTNGPNGGSVLSLIVDPKGLIYAGTLNGGMFISTDKGNTWEQINRGLPSLEIRAMSLTANGNVFVGTGKGYVFMSDNRGKEWTLSASFPSEVHTLLLDSKGHLFAGSGGHGVFRLDSSETDWKQTSLNNVSVQCMDIGFNDELYAATNYGLFLSIDEGESWQRMDTPNIYIFSLVVEPNGHIIAGSWGGKVYYSQNSGNSWKTLNLGQNNSTIWSMSIDKKGNVLACACGTGVLRSQDHGTTWVSMNNGLTDLKVRSIAIGSEEIFVGTTGGIVFKKSGSTFSSSNSNKKSNFFFANLLGFQF